MSYLRPFGLPAGRPSCARELKPDLPLAGCGRTLSDRAVTVHNVVTRLCDTMLGNVCEHVIMLAATHYLIFTNLLARQPASFEYGYEVYDETRSHTPDR